MAATVRLRDLGSTYGGLTGKTKADFGHGSASFVTFLEVINSTRLRGRQLERVQVNRGERQNAVARGDLLFNGSSETPEEVALSAVVDFNPTPNTYLNSFCFGYRLRSGSAADPTYLAYFFRSSAGRALVSSLAQGATRYNIAKTKFLDVELDLPSINHQRRIVQALGDTDELINTLERLIAKKQAIKQGAVQELLTGQTRLPGFGDVWEHRRVSEMGDVLAGKALNVRGAGPLRPYLRTKNVLDGRIDLEDVLRMPMTDAEFERFRIERGDVLLNEGQSLELVGRCSLYNGEFTAPCAMQNQLLRFRAHSGTSPEFAAHLFRHCQRTGVFAAIATQTTSVAHLGSSRLSNLRLLWPTDRLEQAAIAEVLSDLDAEMVAVEAHLHKTSAVKQGMTQELLTGRTRLPIPEAVA